MFLHLSVILFMGGGSLSGGDLCPGGSLSGGSLSSGVSVGGVCVWWGLYPQGVSVMENPPGMMEERAVRILLECILV